jgi:protein O-mannosyl-transferase
MADEGKKPRSAATATPTRAARAGGEPAPENESAADGNENAPRPWLVLVGILLVTAVVYAPALGGPFLWDDRMLIEQTARVRSLGSIGTFFSSGFWADTVHGEQAGAYFRPIATLSFALDHALHGQNPAGFHLTNLALHLACVALLFGWLRQQGNRLGAVALATSLWALAPRLAECVAWMSGRTDVLAGLFSLGALRLWTAPGERSTARDAGACALLFAGLLSKEVALAAVVACSVHAWLAPPRVLGRMLAPLATFGFYLVLRLRALADAPAMGPFDESLGSRAAAILESVGRYAFMIVVPTQPRARLGLRSEPDTTWAVVGALIVIGLAVVAAWWLMRKRPLDPRSATGIVVSTVGLALVVHVIPIPVTASAADRFLYVPFMGLCMLSTPALERLGAAHPRRLAVAACAVLAAFTWRSLAQAQLYADDVAFWSTALEASHPRDLVAHNQLGVLYAEAGMDEEALTALNAARGLGRNGPRNYAAQLRRAGKCAEAVEHWAQIVAAPDSTERDAMALVRSQVCAGRELEALATLSVVRQRFPNEPAWNELRQHIEELQNEQPQVRPADASGWEAVAKRHDRAWQRPQAHAAWLEVARSTDATVDQRLNVAVRLLEDGPLASATEAVERADAAEQDALRLLLEERADRVRRLVVLSSGTGARRP